MFVRKIKFVSDMLIISKNIKRLNDKNTSKFFKLVGKESWEDYSYLTNWKVVIPGKREIL